LIRGLLIPAKTTKHVYFVLDSGNSVMHLFKDLIENEATESINISHGHLSDKMRALIDIESGKVLESFDFQVPGKRNINFTVLGD